MTTSNAAAEWKDRKSVLPTLWVFAVLTYIYADLAPMILNPAAPRFGTGASDGLVLGLAVFMESAIAMALLSRVLRYRANRWANVGVALFHAATITWSLWAGWPPTAYHAFSLIIVVACMVVIAWYAWTWPSTRSQP